MPTLAVTASVSPSISMGRDSSALSSLTMAMALSGFGDVRDDQRELVTSETGHRGLLADRAQQALGHLAEEPVPDCMAQRVVDVLEPVEVEQDDGDAAAAVEGSRRPAEEQLRLGSPVSMSCVA